MSTRFVATASPEYISFESCSISWVRTSKSDGRCLDYGMRDFTFTLNLGALHNRCLFETFALLLTGKHIPSDSRRHPLFPQYEQCYYICRYNSIVVSMILNDINRIGFQRPAPVCGPQQANHHCVFYVYGTNHEHSDLCCRVCTLEWREFGMRGVEGRAETQDWWRDFELNRLCIYDWIIGVINFFGNCLGVIWWSIL